MKLFLATLCSLALGLTVCQANLNFTVAIDTSGLIGNASGPFTLDLQFVDGSGIGDANNTATLTGFNFNGGAWLGNSTTFGSASAVAATITLADASFFSELFQGFTPGNHLSFSVSLSTAVDAGGTPDQFSFAILDGNRSEIPTTGPANELLSVNLDSANPQVSTFASAPNLTSINIPAPTITFAVPDGAVPSALLSVIWSTALLLRREASIVVGSGTMASMSWFR